MPAGSSSLTLKRKRLAVPPVRNLEANERPLSSQTFDGMPQVLFHPDLLEGLFGQGIVLVYLLETVGLSLPFLPFAQ